jgi:hypothetical protein
MPNFPTEKKRTVWTVWRGNTWLGVWSGTPQVDMKIKPRECLMSKRVASIDEKTSRIFVK